MTTIINLAAELGKLTMLQGRTPQSTSADRAGTAAELGSYRDGALFASKFSGIGAWERHPNGEELVQILDGSATLDIVTVDDSQSVEVRAGMLIVVPQDAWHRFRSPNGITLMTATPRPSDHVRSDTDDPRTVEPQRG
jgi:mannose-6-phosphate isomerase-like protein (cupin superfamily)